MSVFDKPAEVAPCQLACPAGIDVPRYIRHIHRGEFEEALLVNRERVPFPWILSYACTHPCETECRCNFIDGPIAIRALKRFVADSGEPLKVKPPAELTGKKVAVIGAGPAGLTAAYYLARLGHGVTVLEARSKPGGMMRWGIPRHVLPEHVLDAEISAVKEAGFEIRTSTHVKSLDGLFEQGYDAILVAVGTQRKVKNLPDAENIPPTSQTLNHLGLIAEKVSTLKVGDKTMATSRGGVFASGEVTSGPTWTIHAIASGRQAAVAIDKYLGGKGDITEKLLPPEGPVKPFVPDLTITRVPIRRLPPTELSGDSAAEQPLTQEEAVTEAKRCLRCDLPILVDSDKCVGCLSCELICSLAKADKFGRAMSHISIERIRGGADYKIFFDEGCDACGLCVRYCTHDVLTREKKEES